MLVFQHRERAEIGVEERNNLEAVFAVIAQAETGLKPEEARVKITAKPEKAQGRISREPMVWAAGPAGT